MQFPLKSYVISLTRDRLGSFIVKDRYSSRHSKKIVFYYQLILRPIKTLRSNSEEWGGSSGRYQNVFLAYSPQRHDCCSGCVFSLPAFLGSYQYFRKKSCRIFHTLFIFRLGSFNVKSETKGCIIAWGPLLETMCRQWTGTQKERQKNAPK